MYDDECPKCGNTNPELIQDNGCKRSDLSFTLLCVAPTSEDTVDGLCGEQWEPNDSEE